MYLKDSFVLTKDLEGGGNYGRIQRKGLNSLMDFKDTVELMLSDNHCDRLRAEYWQTKIRYNRLIDNIAKQHKDELEFKPLVSLNERRDIMFEYLCSLEKQAEMEGIKL